MGKTHKILYVSAAILVVAATVGWIVAFGGSKLEPLYKEENGFILADKRPHSIGLRQVVNDGTGRDGTPSLSQPQFVPIAEATTTESTPGITLEIGGERHFYPYNIIAWHQVINDSIGSTPLVVTYSPQCDSPAIYKRSMGGQSVWFGVSGLSYHKDSLLYDQETQSLWRQSTGEAVVGERTGTKLEKLESEVITWGEAKQKYPTAVALSANTGFSRDYNLASYYINQQGLIKDSCGPDVVQ